MKSSNLSARYVALALAAAVAGCAGTPNGVFQPACLAHAGDRVEFRGDRFEWNRFTDQVSLDDEGNAIDPFPDYPKSGHIKVDGEHVSLTADDGSTIAGRYLYEHRGRTWLLDEKQHAAVQDGQAMPACALVLADGRQQ